MLCRCYARYCIAVLTWHGAIKPITAGVLVVHVGLSFSLGRGAALHIRCRRAGPQVQSSPPEPTTPVALLDQSSPPPPPQYSTSWEFPTRHFRTRKQGPQQLPNIHRPTSRRRRWQQLHSGACLVRPRRGIFCQDTVSTTGIPTASDPCRLVHSSTTVAFPCDAVREGNTVKEGRKADEGSKEGRKERCTSVGRTRF